MSIKVRFRDDAITVDENGVITQIHGQVTGHYLTKDGSEEGYFFDSPIILELPNGLEIETYVSIFGKDDGTCEFPHLELQLERFKAEIDAALRNLI